MSDGVTSNRTWDERRADAREVLGTMIGIELSMDGAPIVQAALQKKLLINCTHGTVLRLLPALTLTDVQAHEGCDIIAECIKNHR